ncbi:MAG TPA: OmpA family protein [Polyangiales bacterium]|nr:OmpA family protein [Polyangiales bacterium]
MLTRGEGTTLAGRCALYTLMLLLAVSTAQAEGARERPDLEAESYAADPPMRRYRPTLLSFEAGVYGGAFLFSGSHNLQDLEQTIVTGHQKLQTGGEVGLRLAFYPLWFFGIEGEGGVIVSKTKRSDDRALIWTGRGHGILQLPLGRLVPFVLGGGGVLALRSDDLGNDVDPVLYFGGGLKLNANQRVALRIDARDNLTQKNRQLAGTKDGDLVHNLELLAGVSVTLGRTPWAARPPDVDKDGLYDRDDRCPTKAGPKPTGCPPPPDGDEDGLPDASDPCPTEAEDGNPPDEKDGCPNRDLDNDRIMIPVDLCPTLPGIPPDGCPPKDSDGDGIYDPSDRCPRDPETKNNFLDYDGCPDELPPQVKKFTGVIKGILFASGNAKIRPASFPLLNDAVRVLQQYPDLRIRISGHTDNTGKVARNQKLSEDRAAAVKTYLVTHGVADSQIQIRGAGPDEPIADNRSALGRTQNRRIEFELLPQ